MLLFEEVWFLFSFHFKSNSFFFEIESSSLCLWGFLCPICLQVQGLNYSHDLEDSSSENPVTESQFERYPPWSCRGLSDSEFLGCYYFSSFCGYYGLYTVKGVIDIERKRAC